MTFGILSSLCTIYSIFVSGFNLCYSNVPKGTCSFCCPIDIKVDVVFKLYTEYNIEIPQFLKVNSEKALWKSNFEFTKSLAIYIHGFGESPTDEEQSAQVIKNQFLLKTTTTMVIIVDWSQLGAGPWYDNAVENINIIAKYVAQFIMFLKNQHYAIKNINLIGFDLGAEIAGAVGNIIVKWGVKLNLLTALDPAFPSFEDSSNISPRSAKFVNVIHTDGGNYGNPTDLGHADFYVNGGEGMQPGCIWQEIAELWLGVITCSHQRAWIYYAESIGNSFAFKAKRCRPSKLFRHCNDLNNFAFMGRGADKRLRGRFYVSTNSRPPYGKYRMEW